MTKQSNAFQAAGSRETTIAYIRLLLEAKQHEAFAMIRSQVDAGVPVESVYLNILQPALYEIGRLWQVDEIDIVMEHYCTAATQLLMAQLYPLAGWAERNNRSMVGCCLGSELHELGMRMVCDVFEFHGWDTFFIGAVTPGESLSRAVVAHRPELVCLSASMPFGLSLVRETIHQIKNEGGENAPKIMVGGLAFMINPQLADAVGADATACDARAAVQLAEELVAA